MEKFIKRKKEMETILNVLILSQILSVSLPTERKQKNIQRILSQRVHISKLNFFEFDKTSDALISINLYQPITKLPYNDDQKKKKKNQIFAKQTSALIINLQYLQCCNI